MEIIILFRHFNHHPYLLISENPQVSFSGTHLRNKRFKIVLRFKKQDWQKASINNLGRRFINLENNNEIFSKRNSQNAFN